MESSWTRDQNPHLLQWQVDSDPLYHQGSPQATIFEESFLLWTVADGYHDCALSRSARDSDTRSRGRPGDQSEGLASSL